MKKIILILTFLFCSKIFAGDGSYNVSSVLADTYVKKSGETGAVDLGGAESLEVPNGTAPTVNASGEIALDTDVITQGFFVGYGASDLNYFVATTDTPADNEIPKYDSSSGTVTWEEDTGGGGASEINLELAPQNGKIPTSNFMVINGGENNWKGLFDDTTDESATWEFIIDDDYGSGTLYADIYYTMASATTGSIVFEIYVMALTSGDSADINTDSYDTVNYVQDTVPGTAGYLKKATITLTNDDSLAAGDYIRFKGARDADGTNGTDSATGDMELIKIIIRE